MDKDLTVSSTSSPGRRRRTRRTPSGVASAASTRTSAAAAATPSADELLQGRPTPQITDELALQLAIVLGVSPMNRRPTCHGYANDCSCTECGARAQNLHRRAAELRQPWHASA
jgi:hypothetical protein